jgi:hypothetical protein
MSVILDEPTAEDWMIPGERDPARLKSLPVPAADDSLVLSPASSLANSVKNNGPELLVPIELSLRNGACFRKRDPDAHWMVTLQSESLPRTKVRREIVLLPALSSGQLARSMFWTARSVTTLYLPSMYFRHGASGSSIYRQVDHSVDR